MSRILLHSVIIYWVLYVCFNIVDFRATCNFFHFVVLMFLEQHVAVTGIYGISVAFGGNGDLVGFELEKGF